MVAAGPWLALLLIMFLCARFHVLADCVYEGVRHRESATVSTAEPCLRCTCVHGTLLCYLRVCPEMPDPPPLGCVLLHRRRACCPELVCPDVHIGGNRIEARYEPDVPELPFNEANVGSGCVHNGTVYGSGSAMVTSSACQYCYCIEGHQRCVRPKCLLPVEGCTPSYAPHSCCPTFYNCTAPAGIRITSTTATTSLAHYQDGCEVNGRRFHEGGKVLGLGHSVCDNCYCVRGSVRCAPLACAPALLGCTPVVPAGECCATSYNCSGVIEVQPKLNYGYHPVVSKEYAKLRKEVQIKRKNDYRTTMQQPSSLPTPLQYVIAKSQNSQKLETYLKHSTPYYFSTSTTTVPSVKQQIATTRHLPLDYKTSNSEPNKSSKISLSTTRISSSSASNVHRPVYEEKVLTKKSVPSELHVSQIKRLELSDVPSISGEPEYSSLMSRSTYSEINKKNGLPIRTHNDEKILDIKYKENIGNYTTNVQSNINISETEFILGMERNIKSKLNVTSEQIKQAPIANETKWRKQSNNVTSNTTIQLETVDSKDEIISSLDSKSHEGLELSEDTREGLENGTRESLKFIEDINDNLLLEGRTNRGIGNVINDEEISTIFTSSDNGMESTTSEFTTLSESSTLLMTTTVDDQFEHPDIVYETTTSPNLLNSEANLTNVHFKISNFTNISDSNIEERIRQSSDIGDYTSTTETDLTSTPNPTIIPIEDSSNGNNLTATMHPIKKIPPEIEAILNITKNINKKDEEYEYDYSEPSLPPSLPNVRIIPFVAADAVENESPPAPLPTIYSTLSKDNLRTENPLFTYTINMFSPPIETEGGFVPRNPPILNKFYDKNFHTTSVVDITTSTAVPVITNPPREKEDNCVVDGREIRHGELTSEIGACSICLCLFGEVVCEPPKCPTTPVGCHRLQSTASNCCGQVVCNVEPAEAPTVVLDRIDVTLNPTDKVTVAEGVATPDPFRDVIRTEPAPDLKSLIGDMMPFLVRQTTFHKLVHNITTAKPVSTTEISLTTDINSENRSVLSPELKTEEDNEFSFDTVLKLLFSENPKEYKPGISTIETERPTTTIAYLSTENNQLNATSLNLRRLTLVKKTNNFNQNSIESSSTVGLLKLAGCNIYGRMYRVGRIISELSGPCLECMCTDVGVQCRSLDC